MDWEILGKGLKKTIEDYGNIQAQDIKLRSSLLANQIEKKQNLIYKIQEQKAMRDENIAFAKQMQGVFGGGQDGQQDEVTAPRMGFGADMKPTFSVPSSGQQKLNIERKWAEIDQKQTNNMPLNNLDKMFMERYPKSMLNKKGQKTLISPMIAKISQNEDAYYSLGNSLENLQGNADKFSQFMGPGKGVLRNPMRSYVNKDLQDFLAWKANVQDAFQQYRVAVTGAQASDKEIALLAKNRPTENDTYDVFIKKSNKVRETGNQVIRRYITNLSKAGYDVSGYQDTLKSLDEELGGLTGNQPIEQIQRIKVKSPNGQIGNIPIEQLQDALTQGYQKVE